jgi:Zn-dependent protease with chaperone function
MLFYAILSIFMVVVSYLFVILLAAACVYLPFLMLVNSQSGLFLFLFGIVIAATMVWSLLPRPDKFKPHGLLLERERQPRLFAELETIAASLGEPMPREVYLMGDVNAWVTDRGGFMGIGSRRIMGIGLPLLSIVDISQFRAILAHEFAHYYGGDTRLGPLVYRTQTAIARIFQNIGSLSGLARIAILGVMYVVVSTILKWYFLLFLRAINLVSRKKEYRADELACLVAGRQPLIDGLRAIHGGAPAWPVYWNSELLPVIRDGVVPGIAEGFTRFISIPGIQSQIESHLSKEIAEAQSNPYDTHPSLRNRIAAVQQLPERTLQKNSLPARSLLDQADAVEVKFLECLYPEFKPGTLTSITWEIVGDRVTIPGWKEYAGEYSRLLRGVTPESLPDQIPNLRNVGFEIRDPKGMLLSPEQRTERAAGLFAVGLGLTLLDHGWTLHKEPGVFYLQRNSDQLNPFAIVEQLRSGKLSGSDWRTQCRELGIGDLAFQAINVPDSGDGV